MTNSVASSKPLAKQSRREMFNLRCQTSHAVLRSSFGTTGMLSLAASLV